MDVRIKKASTFMSNIHFVIENNIGLLTINRPEKLNALNEEVLGELKVLLSEIKSKRLTGLLFMGAGEKAFIAGADISAMNDMKASDGLAFGKLGQAVTTDFENLPFPTIACVQGFALGGGFEMALACDFIFASEKAIFGLPEVKLGLIPGFGGTQRLARRANLALAKELIFSGRNMTAIEAKERGVINQLFSSQEELMTGAKAYLAQVAKNSPLAISVAKIAINQGSQTTLEQGLGIEVNSFSGLFGSYDTKEGTAAFLAKRKAEFKGE